MAGGVTRGIDMPIPLVAPLQLKPPAAQELVGRAQLEQRHSLHRQVLRRQHPQDGQLAQRRVHLRVVRADRHELVS